MARVANLTSVVVLVALFSTCSAWDPFGIGGSISKKIKEAGEKLIGKAKEAFEEAMQDLFDKEINPLVDKVNAMVLEDAEAIKQDVEEVIANATKEIEDLIDHAAAVAQKFADHELEEIKEKIIDEAAAKVNECTDHFFQGVDDVLQKFYQVVKQINCMVQGDIDKIYEDVYKFIGTGCLFPDKCCRQQGVAFKSLKSMGDSQLYGLEVCRRTSSLTPTTPAEELRKAYLDCQIIAKKFFCIDFGTGSARNFFSQEYNKWGVKYDFWSHPVQLDHALVAPEQQLNVKDDPCGSPVDCYQQAIAKLDQARKEIADKADKDDVEPLISVQQEELKLFYGQSCPQGWTEASLTKGYMLVGRPDGGKTGLQLNAPLKNQESGRVGPHGHTVSDAGHSHNVVDNGHTHQSGMNGGTSGARSSNHDSSGSINYPIITSSAKTGISVASSNSGVSIPSGVATGLSSTEHYPLSYVLVCQKQSSLDSVFGSVLV